MTIAQAVEYFGDQVDSYIDSGEVEDNTPSQILLINNDGSVERIR